MTLKPNTSTELEFINILKSKHARYIDGVRVIDEDKVADDYVPPGAVMGKVDSSGKYAPVTRDKIDTAGANSGTGVIPLQNLNASDFHNWQVGDGLNIKTSVDAVKASLMTGVEGDNTAIEWTAVDAGSAGNGISVTLEDPSGNDESLAVTTNHNDITVSLATGASGDITSTASEIITAIEADAEASALVAVDDYGDSDGSGTVEAESEANLTGGSDASDNLEVDESATITAIDESAGEITVDSIAEAYAEDTVVEKSDGSSEAEFVCTELADVSEEDAMVGGIVHGAVYADRLPNYDSLVDEDLPQIAFE